MTVQGLEEITHEVENGVAAQRSVITIRTALEETSVAMDALAETERSQGLSEQRFRLAFEDNMAPMLFSDSDDLAIAVNDAFCEMVGFSREELLGHDTTISPIPRTSRSRRNRTKAWSRTAPTKSATSSATCARTVRSSLRRCRARRPR